MQTTTWMYMWGIKNYSTKIGITKNKPLKRVSAINKYIPRLKDFEIAVIDISNIDFEPREFEKYVILTLKHIYGQDNYICRNRIYNNLYLRSGYTEFFKCSVSQAFAEAFILKCVKFNEIDKHFKDMFC